MPEKSGKNTCRRLENRGDKRERKPVSVREILIELGFDLPSEEEQVANQLYNLNHSKF